MSDKAQLKETILNLINEKLEEAQREFDEELEEFLTGQIKTDTFVLQAEAKRDRLREALYLAASEIKTGA